jgi:HAD superfamily hydrolase (TIGR01509 family)
METGCFWEKYKGAIFDLDGTILDSMGLWRQIDVEFAQKRGLPLPDEYVRSISAMDAKQAAKYTVDFFGLSETPEELMNEWYEMAEAAYAGAIPLKPCAYEYLRKLHANGMKLMIATASDIALCTSALVNHGVREWFSSITTATEVEKGKGSPDIYIRAAEKEGLSPNECVVFEDILAGIKGSKAGGFYTVGIYDEHSKNEWEEITRVADMSIRSFEELIACKGK